MLIDTEQSRALENMPVRTALIMGMLTKDNQKMANIPNEDRSLYSKTRYEFMLDAPFEVSGMCCNVMKKNPAHKFHKDTGKVPIIATMASESRLRTQKWLQNGCNAWNTKIPTSTPMSFWTEQDVLLYIKEKNLPICSVYGDVVVDDGVNDGQMCIGDYASEVGLFDFGNPPLKTTGCQRTGCMLCAFGCTQEKESRFLRLKETHPNMYILMDNIKNNGYSFNQALDWINENGGFDIKH